MPTDFGRITQVLSGGGVEFVLVGGLALTALGSPRSTEDYDVCYGRRRENLERLASALGPFHPTLRGAPPELPFQLDVPTLKFGLNFTLNTDLGQIDLLGEIAGIGPYDAVVALAVEKEMYGCRIHILGLEGLERAKSAAGRLKDLGDLEIIRALKKRSP